MIQAVEQKQDIAQEMLPGAPWLLAHKSMLPVNQPFKVSLQGQDYVLWKDQQGAVHGLPNICPHMGAMLSEGWCEAHSNGSSAVVCPFHALAFDAEGRTILPGGSQENPKKTLPQLDPLELIIQEDFIWSYGGAEPTMPVPNILNQIAENYELIGATGETSVATPLLPMLLNMHDYNHQNGTHREMFRIEEVQFDKFVDEGHHSEAFMKMPKATSTWREVIQNPAVLIMPPVLKVHLENFFPSMVILWSNTVTGPVAQCHFFIPESAERTRTYVLLFAQLKSPVFKLMKGSFLKLVATVVEQDADILGKLYQDQPQKIKLNNEIGMDWVQRNFENWPAIAQPNLSK